MPEAEVVTRQRWYCQSGWMRAEIGPQLKLHKQHLLLLQQQTVLHWQQQIKRPQQHWRRTSFWQRIQCGQRYERMRDRRQRVTNSSIGVVHVIIAIIDITTTTATATTAIPHHLLQYPCIRRKTQRSRGVNTHSFPNLEEVKKRKKKESSDKSKNKRRKPCEGKITTDLIENRGCTNHDKFLTA